MHWVRANIRVGSWLALFALTLQLSILFGHRHFDGDHGPFSPTSFIAGESNISGSLDSDSHKPTKLADTCPICALLNIAGLSLIAEPPSLSAPIVLSLAVVSIAFDGPVIALARLTPQARAPPAV
jgi:hypothetical protein